MQHENAKAAVVVVGSTCVGKTKLGISLAQAFDGEVISVDSLQCYKHGQILTAAPDKNEQLAAPHHLVGYLHSDEEPFQDYIMHVQRALSGIHARSKTPIFVGGSMSLYPLIIAHLLHEDYKIQTLFLEPCWKSSWYADKIEMRVAAMVEAGLVEEVKELMHLQSCSELDAASSHNAGIWKAIGYREILPFVQSGEDADETSESEVEGVKALACSSALLETCLKNLKINTIDYAERQLKWANEIFIPFLEAEQIPCHTITVKSQAWERIVERRCQNLVRSFLHREPVIKNLSSRVTKDQQKPQTVCIFGGSSSGIDEAQVAGAIELGRIFHANNIRVVYGGGTTGIMGAIAAELVSLSGPQAVHGIIPAALAEYEARNSNEQTAYSRQRFGERTIVADMHTRKRLMVEQVLYGGENSGFVALGGGLGTMEELFEVITWRQLGIHDRSVCVLNMNGFYAGLMDWIDHLARQGFVDHRDAQLLISATSPQQIVDGLNKQGNASNRHALQWKSL